MTERRLTWELIEVKGVENELNFKNIELINENLFFWEGYFKPDFAPYKKGIFRISFDFPSKNGLIFSDFIFNSS